MAILRSVLLLMLMSGLVGCGYSAGNTSTGPSGTQSVTGTVNSVGLTQVNNGSGGLQTATAVVLMEPLGTTNLVFCGDDRSSFTVNASIQVTYNNGVYCATLMTVTPH